MPNIVTHEVKTFTTSYGPGCPDFENSLIATNGQNHYAHKVIWNPLLRLVQGSGSNQRIGRSIQILKECFTFCWYLRLGARMDVPVRTIIWEQNGENHEPSQADVLDFGHTPALEPAGTYCANLPPDATLAMEHPIKVSRKGNIVHYNKTSVLQNITGYELPDAIKEPNGGNDGARCGWFSQELADKWCQYKRRQVEWEGVGHQDTPGQIKIGGIYFLMNPDFHGLEHDEIDHTVIANNNYNIPDNGYRYCGAVELLATYSCQFVDS